MSRSSNEEPCMIFRLNDDGMGPELVKEAFYERGWVEYDEDIHADAQWNIWWKTSRFRTSDYNHLYPWQRVNHCPKATGITRKDCLARLLKLQQALHGSAYNFAPQSYILPNDYRKFTQEFSNQPERGKSNKFPCWICKPADLSRGRGIVIIRELSELQYDTNTIVQQYITDPMLIHGHKFDIRLYVVVVSYHPLVIYLYNDGLVRFSCEKYDLSSLGNVYAHLTNTSINKYSSAFNVDKAGIGHGSKWTLKQFRHYLHQRHIDDYVLWWQIVLIINLTIIPQVSEVPRTANCFELYGFDVLVDSNMKPWLLEVNFSPSLSSDCTADGIKKEMLSDLIDLMDFKPQDTRHGANDFQQSLEPVRYAPSRTKSKQTTVRSNYRRPHSMVTRLPQLAASQVRVKPRYCVSVNDSSEHYASEDDEDGESSAPDGNVSNILNCSLSQLSLPPAGLVHSSPASSMTRQQTVMLGKSNAGYYGAKSPMSYGQSELITLRHSVRSTAKPKCYNKPWRQDSGSVRIQRLGSAEKSHVVGRKAVVGGFHRTYPFNTLTSTKQLSPRQMVIEAHQMIRSKISDRSASQTSKPSTDGATSSRRYVKPFGSTDIISPFPTLKS